MIMMNVTPIPALQDNYIWLLIDSSGTVAVIDPAEAAPVIEELDKRSLTLDYILNTHHHWDHTGANLKLKNRYGCKIIGATNDAHRIPGIDRQVSEGDIVTIGNTKSRIIETPGHTSGHICFYFAEDKALFCGDTIFSMGCGKLFEGTPAQMWESLSKLVTLPDDTMIYCAHEYTLENGAFVENREPDNEAVKARMAEARTLRAQNKPTLPISLAEEKRTNPFLRAGSLETFAKVRSDRDNW